MSQTPLICFGQQPCGFFPRRFLYAKIQTALRLQREIGGEIVFFLHDSDHDPRETRTTLRHRRIEEVLQLNFAFANKTQRKFSPLFLKKIDPTWQAKTALQLPAYVAPRWVQAFKEVVATNVADFCLEMYRKMGLLDGIRVARSGDPAFRQAACEIQDFFVDVPYEGEIVRARLLDGELKLHEGGDSFVTLPKTDFTKGQISPTRDSRLRWMQSVLHCTHYIAGAGEQAYLHHEDAPDITFLTRDTIDRSDEAYTDCPD
ncbi:MAG TPA: hypothetical protein VMF06_16720 [Candidatus Limnocylindria bacterium]|nr:hypothetical protein [Candidatus Limnocylindria bacterium]